MEDIVGLIDAAAQPVMKSGHIGNEVSRCNIEKAQPYAPLTF